MMTAEQYIQSLRDLRPRKIYVMGELIDNPVDHPLIRPSINCCAMTYKLAELPEYEDLMTATSALSGKKINRFCNLHQSPSDLIKKVKMQRLLGNMTG
ncbi:MAG: 4-hydroxyphenylacetate 3-hydroxylase N-terminal domain-containing protein, partial [Chitinophagales bacterium]